MNEQTGDGPLVSQNTESGLGVVGSRCRRWEEMTGKDTKEVGVVAEEEEVWEEGHSTPRRGQN